MVADGKQVVASVKQVLPSATKEQKRTVFVKPTIEEIRAYIAEKGYHFSAEQFFAFYESKGWKVGSQPMKDWKMACVTWEGRTGNRTQQPTQSQQPRKTFTDWNSTEALTEQYNIEAERRKKQQEEEDRESRIRSFQVQILDYLSRHRDDYKTLEQGDVKENDYFTITGLPDGTMYWNCKCANCKRRTYYDEAMKCVNECPLDAPMRPKGDDDTSYIWDKVSKMWVMY
jgi:ferredoxin